MNVETETKEELVRSMTMKELKEAHWDEVYMSEQQTRFKLERSSEDDHWRQVLDDELARRGWGVETPWAETGGEE